MDRGRWIALGLVACAAASLTGCTRVGMEPAPTPVPSDVGLDAPPRPQIPERRADPQREVRRADRPAAVRLDPGDVPEPSEPAVWGPGSDEILTSAYARNPDIQDQVDFWLDFWQGRGREYFQRYLHRMVVYQPHVDRELQKRDLPWSLRYLPVVESGYSPTVVSRVGATGLWQFMSGTARWLGLRVDGFVDERRDPLRSTETALDYLVTLRGDFGSWFLALAAYNSGPGRVRGLVRRYADDAPLGDSLFWALSDRFPNETSYFVPKLLAATQLASNPVRYGFQAPDLADSLRFELVEVPDGTSLDVVAQAALAELEDVVGLNPHLVQRVTPFRTTWSVRVPIGRSEGFEARLAEVPPDERVTFVQHRVARGETLGHIAERYGIRLSQLTAANPGLSPRRLQIGQRLIVPVGPATSGTASVARAAEGAEPSTASQTEPVVRSASSTDASVVHVVRSGESPWTIAREYGVSLDALQSWNGLDDDSVVRPGDRLEVRGARVATYRVRAGDTLSEIAERHGVSTVALLRVNGLTTRSVIRPGQVVRIPQP